jgi:hypothetical protein
MAEPTSIAPTTTETTASSPFDESPNWIKPVVEKNGMR